MAKKLALALGVLLLLVAALEGAAHVALRSQAPVWVRDGLYENPLPLVTAEAGAPINLAFLPRGERRLAPEKAPGELRVAVVGESSVAGSPLDVHASMPAILLDELRRRLPETPVTVLNMGRPGSVSTNSFYYLVYLRRFAPDVIVFYMGMNDDAFQAGEQCLLGEHPWAYRAWLRLVEASGAVWLARTWGVQYLWRATHKTDWYKVADCSVPTYGLWTELLVRFARGMGARVVIADPVYSPVRFVVDPESAHSVEPARWRDDDRALLRCALEDGCDVDAGVAAALSRTRFPWLFSERYLYLYDVALRATAWKRAALAAGAALIPFEELLASMSPHGLPSVHLFSDWLRLRPPSYLLLARLIADRIAWMQTGTYRPTPLVLPTLDEVRPYLDATQMSGMRNVLEQFHFHSLLPMISGLRFYLSVFDGPSCERKHLCDSFAVGRLALAWLRREAGLDPGLPDDQRAALDAFDPLSIHPQDYQ
jgi:hypothetical protein